MTNGQATSSTHRNGGNSSSTRYVRSFFHFFFCSTDIFFTIRLHAHLCDRSLWVSLNLPTKSDLSNILDSYEAMWATDATSPPMPYNTRRLSLNQRNWKACRYSPVIHSLCSSSLFLLTGCLIEEKCKNWPTIWSAYHTCLLWRGQNQSFSARKPALNTIIPRLHISS